VLEFWLLLGVTSSLGEQLAERNPRFVNGRLLVSARFRSSDTAHADVVALILGVYRFVRFVAGRFVGGGKAFSALMAGTFIGLDAMCAKMWATDGESTWYLAGYRSFTQACRLLHPKAS